MHIRAAEIRPPIPDLQPLAALRSHTSHAGHLTDSISASAGQLANPSVQHLLNAIEGRLTHAAPTAAGAFDAREAAGKSMLAAAHAIDTARHNRIPDNLEPRNVLALANQFIQTGQYINYLRAAELGKEIASWYDGPIALPVTSLALQTRQPKPVREALKKIWRRAPLLTLFTGWLVPGILVGLFLRLLHIPAWKSATAFDIWGIGFLVLVLVQFVVSIRGFVAQWLHAIMRRR